MADEKEAAMQGVERDRKSERKMNAGPKEGEGEATGEKKSGSDKVLNTSPSSSKVRTPRVGIVREVAAWSS